MKIIGVIPSRYASSRFPGKALEDIHGKPMIVRVYEKAASAKTLAEVVVATDDERIAGVCRGNGIRFIMTSNDIAFMTERVYAASLEIDADAYYCIPGDEPLVSPAAIDKVAQRFMCDPAFDVVHAIGEIEDAAEVIDNANLKTVAKENGECVYISRSPIPYPKGAFNDKYCKLVCGGIFSKAGLAFFHSTQKGAIETAEDCDIVRFIEHGRKVLLVKIEDKTLSVDTPKDLVRVRELFKTEDI